MYPRWVAHPLLHPTTLERSASRILEEAKIRMLPQDKLFIGTYNLRSMSSHPGAPSWSGRRVETNQMGTSEKRLPGKNVRTHNQDISSSK